MNTLKTSKITILTLLVVLGSLFTSCENDGVEERGPSLSGTWFKISVRDELFTNGALTTFNTNYFESKDTTTFLFKEDKTFLESNTLESKKTNVKSGMYAIEGSEVSATYDGNPESEEFDFVFTGNLLSVIFTNEYTENGNQIKHIITAIYRRQ